MAKTTKKTKAKKPTLQNRKARFRFEFLETIECGIVLRGTEVKSIRTGGGSLEEAFAHLQGAEIWLRGFHIPPYEHGSVRNHEPLRPKKLLLHKREVLKLKPKLIQQGLTLIPANLYFNDRGIAKLTLALARGKTHSDKRQDLKKRDDKREMDRAMKR